MSITLTDVAKDYSSSVKIGPVTTEIQSGGVTALVGPNGAGKSTILTMIGRLLGHANPQSTARYAHLDDAHVLDAAEQIGAAIEPP